MEIEEKEKFDRKESTEFKMISIYVCLCVCVYIYNKMYINYVL